MTTGPVPVAVRTRVFTNSRRQKLHALSYGPPKTQKMAVLFIHHGLAEHCGRYDKVCRLLASNGIEVHTFDAHGHGRSEPLDERGRAYVADYEHLVDDMCGFMDWVLAGGEEATEEAAGPRPPVFLLGHSMGGMVASMTALRRQQDLAGIMLHSPALDVEWNLVLRMQAAVGGLMSRLVPRARLVPAVRPEDMSPDPAVVADYVSDPLNTVGPIRARTANEMLRAFGVLRRRARELSLPVYVAHGTQDRCTNFAASRRFVEGPDGCVSSVHKVFRPVEGGYHELLHGPEWLECTMEMLRWKQARVAGAMGGGAAAAAGAGSSAEGSSDSAETEPGGDAAGAAAASRL